MKELPWLALGIAMSDAAKRTKLTESVPIFAFEGLAKELFLALQSKPDAANVLKKLGVLPGPGSLADAILEAVRVLGLKKAQQALFGGLDLRSVLMKPDEFGALVKERQRALDNLMEKSK